MRPSLISAACAALVLALPAGQSAQAKDDVPALLKQLDDKDEAVRLKAAKTLGRMGVDAKDALDALREAARSDPDADVRSVAKQSLQKIQDALSEQGGKEIRKVLEPLVKDLKNKRPEYRLKAIEKLAEMGTSAREAGGALVDCIVTDRSQTVREAAIEALEKVDPAVHKHVVTLLFDSSEQAKRTAVSALGDMGTRGKAALPALLLHYQNEVLRGYDAVNALVAVVRVAPDNRATVQVVLEAVSMPPLGGDRGTRLFLLRSKAIGLLKDLKLEPKQVVPALIAALNDGTCRVQAIQELGKLGPEAKVALPILTRLKLDSSGQVPEAAAAAIDAIKE
jgi:HEAT repeat protein